jgi:dihydroorotate dehydrogenase
LIACGATHVALGTVLFSDHDAPSRVRHELAEESKRLGFDTPADAFCAALEDVVLTGN